MLTIILQYTVSREDWNRICLVNICNDCGRATYSSHYAKILRTEVESPAVSICFKYQISSLRRDVQSIYCFCQGVPLNNERLYQRFPYLSFQEAQGPLWAIKIGLKPNTRRSGWVRPGPTWALIKPK